MVWFEEIKPYFIRSRISGLFPFSFVDGHLLQSKGEYVYAIITAVLRIIGNSWAMIYYLQGEQLIILDYFLMFHAITACTSLLYGTYKSLTRSVEIKAAMDFIRKYDDAVRLRLAMRKLAIFNWTIILLLIPHEIYLNYYGGGFIDILCLIFWIERSLIWWNTVAQFTAIVFSLARRFRNLGSLLISDTATILDENRSYYRSVYLEDVRRLHGYLVKAAKNINAMYTIPLLLWIFDLTLKMTWTIYLLLVYSANKLNMFKASFNLSVDMIFLATLLIACNEATAQKNVMGGQYFMLNPLKFSAMYGLYDVDLLLLYTLLGAVTTVLVVICGS